MFSLAETISGAETQVQIGMKQKKEMIRDDLDSFHTKVQRQPQATEFTSKHIKADCKASLNIHVCFFLQLDLNFYKHMDCFPVSLAVNF